MSKNNTNKVFITLGASSHTSRDRERDDYYATDPKATEILLKCEKFAPLVWECACGEGHISKVLSANGYNVKSTDLVYRGYGTPQPFNFLKENITEFDGDIITNPPYKYATEFVRKAINVVKPGHKVAMFLRVLFLEGKKRKELFEKHPPKTIYVSSSRLLCARNGDFELARQTNSAIAYGWFVWKKGFQGNPIVKWVN